jgi:hypothetical protein
MINSKAVQLVFITIISPFDPKLTVDAARADYRLPFGREKSGHDGTKGMVIGKVGNGECQSIAF